MPTRLIIHPNALADLDDIVAYIAQDHPLNAGRFAERLARDIRALTVFPRRGRIAREHGVYDLELRQLSVYPYRVIYTIVEQTVYVLRIVHGHRDDLSSDDLPAPSAK